ncbi:MAG: glycosyltransferase family 4 protein [Ferruginibacter sp.]|nr:glycosyltransferase family 4 protein [Chitinophagaceae bacterium]MBP6286373.1 glycosyltransferase family 4 protein [Ferruginibacter sp.]MBU9937470.1 glycosyltransferase family 4 protein [Ferruginibacter sp.]
MKRIIFDCERMKYPDTGLFHYCLNLGNHLATYNTPGEEEITFYSPNPAAKFFDPGSKLINQYELHKLRMPSLKRYGIWHATYQDSYYLPFRNKQIKVVLSIHDLNFMYDDSKPEGKKQKYLRRLQMLINRADVIICVSEYSKKDVSFYCDTNNKPVHVIHNGTNTLTEPRLGTCSYQPLKPFIFSLGTMNHKKNFHTLLPLVQQHKDMELVIAGRRDDNNYHNFILDTAEKMGIHDNLRLVGSISEAEKSWYFNNCCAFAFPSNAEGFGLPVTEAMSVGKPIFLSQRTALPEIGGDVAFYFQNFSAAHMKETFVAGMKRYKRFNMKEDIIKKGKEYCWDHAAQEYWKIYRSLY